MILYILHTVPGTALRILFTNVYTGTHHSTQRVHSAAQPPCAMGSRECDPLPSWGLPVGVAMGVIGSIGINVGQNIQAAGLQKLPKLERARPCQSQQWIRGQLVFIVFALINFSALALAPASVLTPLESIQFVTNVVYNKYINGAVVSQRMMVGVALALLGTVLSVVFGASGGGCHSVAVLESYWQQWPWRVYMPASLGVAAGAWFTYHRYAARLAEGQPLRNHRVMMPVLYTLAAALAGGAQMIVHSKVFSEMLGMILSGEGSPIIRHWMLYLEVVLVVVCGAIWLYKLTECLTLFDPLLILPLMTGIYVLFGGVAGGIFFREFERLDEGLLGPASWLAYILGVLCVSLQPTTYSLQPTAYSLPPEGPVRPVPG